jgi:hypothetical protein
MKLEDGIEKISPDFYHSYNIMLNHNPKELQHQFHLGKNLRKHG